MNKVFVSSDELHTLKRIFEKVDGVYLFGSRIKGTHKKFSDLDICIQSEKFLSRIEMGDLKEQLEDSNLPFVVDLSFYSDLPSFIQESFERDKVLLKNAVST